MNLSTNLYQLLCKYSWKSMFGECHSWCLDWYKMGFGFLQREFLGVDWGKEQRQQFCQHLHVEEMEGAFLWHFLLQHHFLKITLKYEDKFLYTFACTEFDNFFSKLHNRANFDCNTTYNTYNPINIDKLVYLRLCQALYRIF